MAFGYHDKILRVNLSTGEIHTECLGDEFFRTYFGGWGIISHYLFHEVPVGADPLGPDNLLIFATGIITGAPIPGSGRHAVGGKSALSGGFAGSEAGGYWGAELKNAGWDAIVIAGQSDKPVYLWIKDNQVEIRDARALWGQETATVEAMIRAELGDEKVRVAQIGVAGENLVRVASVMHDATRAAGRTGQGAVMGSKRLKAVAVRGTGRVPVANREKVMELAKWLRDNVAQVMGAYYTHGTSGFLSGLNATGGLPTRNFQEGTFEQATAISGETMNSTLLVDTESCWACPVHCKRVVKTTGRYNVDPVYGGPEYETLASFGSLCGNGDLESIAYANQLCNAYGLDTIGTGVVIAWAMECFERGLLTAKDTGGLELRFGNVDAILQLIEGIAHRTGLGAVLAEGSMRAAERIGRGTERYAMHVKGQEIPMHEPRLKAGLGIGYATSPTGADHCHNFHDTMFAAEGRNTEEMRSLGVRAPLPPDDLGPDKVRLMQVATNKRLLANALGMCYFLAYSYAQLRDLVQGVTGWNTTEVELLLVAERTLALSRAFNYREGFVAEDDVSHWRFSTPFVTGPNAGARVREEDIRKAIDLYYGYRGWDKETGAPTSARLHELGLHWLSEELYRA